MRVPHYAKRSLAVLALAVVMAGCGGGDSTGPDDAPFDPAGTSSDIDAIGESFESDAMSAYMGAAQAISITLGESPAAMAVLAAPTKALVTGGKPAAGHYAQRLVKIYAPRTAAVRPSLSTAAVLDEHLGVTFTRDPETLEYGPSDLPGAPANGVRFIVYAVDPISLQPITPLSEVGYADVEITESASAASIRVELVSSNVTYLDYTVGASGNDSSVLVTVSGFASNGQDRVNFDLDNRLDFDLETIVLDYSLVVPTRGNFRIDFEGESTSTGVTSLLVARGPHGNVSIAGTQTSTTATFEVEVNGEPFATITVPEVGEPTITGADGEALTQEELEALDQVFRVFMEGFDFFEDLLDPLV